MVLPPPRDPITGEPIREYDPIQAAKDAKKKNFYATANDKTKVRMSMIDLFDSIKKYNSEVTRLIDFGLNEKSIEVIFDAKYKNYGDAVRDIFKDSNLQSSGGEMIPYLAIEQIEELLAQLFNTQIGAGTTRAQIIAATLNNINTRRQAVITEGQVLSEDSTAFRNVRSSRALTIALYGRVEAIFGTTWGQRLNSNGTYVNISGTDTIRFVDYILAEEPDIILKINMLIINLICSKGVTIAKSKQTGITKYNDLADRLINEIINDRQTLAYIRGVLLELLENHPPSPDWQFTPNYDIPNIGGDLIKEQGRTIEDQAYLNIRNANQLTDEQANALIDIISNLSANKSAETTEEEFTTIVTNFFIELINKANSTATSSTATSSVLSNVLNYISSNSDVILEIGRLILNPTPKAIASIIQEIINSAQTVQINTSGTSSEIPDSTILPTTAISVSQDDSEDAFIKVINEEKYENDEVKVPGELFEVVLRNNRTPDIMRGVSTEQVINEQGDLVTVSIPFNRLMDRIAREQGIELTTFSSSNEVTPQDVRDVANIIKFKKPDPAMKKKLNSVMEELRKKFGKVALTRLYIVNVVDDQIGPIQEQFATRQAAVNWLHQRRYNNPEQYITIKYGVRRDYTEEDANDANRLLYYPEGDGGNPPDGGDGGPPDGGGDGDPSGAQGRRRRRRGPIRRRGQVFNGLTKRQYLLLFIVIALLSTGTVSLEEVLKAGKDLDDGGKTSDPTTTPDKPIDPDKPVVPVVPDKPTKPDGTFNKIAHNEFWDSVGLSGIIDIYNGMVDNYNGLSAADKKAYKSVVEKYYDKFSETANLPTLKELKEARKRYDNLKNLYDNSDNLSFEQINSIYVELKKSMQYLDKMTNKYLATENKVFDINKNKDDADVTIDDVDADISLQTKLNTKVSSGSNKALLNTSYAVLSKGMRERIARKLAGKGDYSAGIIAENQEFINFSLVKPNAGLGTAYNNPLIYRNKEYEIKQYTNNYANPQPYKVPSMNQLIKNSKQEKSRLYNIIQIDDMLNYDAGNKLINQKLQDPNINPVQFGKSRLYNPEYHLEQLNNQPAPMNTMNNHIGQCGVYYGLKGHNKKEASDVTLDQYYNIGGNTQLKQSQALNRYPDTPEIKFSKPVCHRTIKENRMLPSTFSLK